MKTLKALSLLGLVGITLVGSDSAQAQITKQGDGYLFRIKWTPGTTVKYVMNMSMTNPETKAPMNMNMTVTQKVKSVKNGTATIDATTSGVMGGQPQKMTMTIDNRGRTTGAGAGGSQIAYPEKPIRIGETWKGALPGMGQGMAGDAVYKLISVKSMNGKQVAQVSLSMNISQGAAMKMTGSGMMYLIVGDGSLSNMNMNMDMTMSNQGKTQKMKMGMTMKRA